jgi:hypothetical protein
MYASEITDLIEGVRALTSAAQQADIERETLRLQAVVARRQVLIEAQDEATKAVGQVYQDLIAAHDDEIASLTAAVDLMKGTADGM